jgi:hypothetical protein
VGKPGGRAAPDPARIAITTRRASIIANATPHSHQARRVALPPRTPRCWVLSGRVTDRRLPAWPRQQDNAPSAHSALDPYRHNGWPPSSCCHHALPHSRCRGSEHLAGPGDLPAS